MKYPVTQAIRFLRSKKVDFVSHLYEYEEKGGTSQSSEILGVEEHTVIKTLVFETSEKEPLIVLQHGDLQVSAKNLARHLGVKSVSPVSPEKANKLTGYLLGGTSPFGTKKRLPIYAEKTIFDLEKIYVNGGKRGVLIEIVPGVLSETLRIEKVSIGIQ